MFATDRNLAATEDLRAIAARGQGLRGAEAFRFLWKDFIIPLAETMLPGVEAAVEWFAPDVLIAAGMGIFGMATTALFLCGIPLMAPTVCEGRSHRVGASLTHTEGQTSEPSPAARRRATARSPDRAGCGKTGDSGWTGAGCGRRCLGPRTPSKYLGTSVRTVRTQSKHRATECLAENCLWGLVEEVPAIRPGERFNHRHPPPESPECVPPVGTGIHRWWPPSPHFFAAAERLWRKAATLLRLPHVDTLHHLR